MLHPPFPLPDAAPEALGLDPARLDRLCAAVEAWIAGGLCTAAEIAVARRGQLALWQRFGLRPPVPGREPLWLLYSNTKVIIAACLWLLVEEGRLSFGDTVARHMPDFAQHGKGDITIIQLLTHQGGFPLATVPTEAWADHALLRRTVCGFTLDWEPGSRVRYHPGAAHWVAAALIEAITGRDYRDVVRDRVLAPLGLERDIRIGLPDAEHDRAVPMREPAGEGGALVVRETEADPRFLRAGVPGGGGYGTARGMAAFYQMLGAGGVLGDVRLLASRTLAYVTRNVTGERVDEYIGTAMHWGLGPHSRGETALGHGLGSTAHPSTFGHGGVGSSYCWVDPESGVSFAFLSDTRQTDAVHRSRMETLSTLVHAAILA